MSRQAFLILRPSNNAVCVGASYSPPAWLEALEQQTGERLELVCRVDDLAIEAAMRDGYLAEGYTQQGAWLVPPSEEVAS